MHGPINAICATLACRAADPHANTVAALLDARLRGQVVAVGWAHGDYLPVNLLAAPDGQVSAIIDWCTASPDDLSVLDIATFLPMAESMARGEEFGPVVRRWLGGVPRAETEVLVECQSALGGSVLPPEVLVLLGWLKHVGVCVSRTDRTAANPVWNRRNVRVVVQAAARQAEKWAGSPVHR